MENKQNGYTIPSWRRKGLGILRILFGLIWVLDAQFKWRPDFVNHFTDYLTGAQTGQPAIIKHWIGLWVSLVQGNPQLFGYIVAFTETAIALGLILGLLSNLTYLVGSSLSLVIWVTAEGLGGPYGPGSTDVGTAIIYIFAFAAFYFTQAGLIYGLDRRLSKVLGRFNFLASGKVSEESEEKES